MGNVSREMEILKRNPKEMLEIQNTVGEMKRVVDVCISRPDAAEETLSELVGYLSRN